MSAPDPKALAAAAYDAASDHYDAPPLAFWERYGRRTVERLGLAPGAHVLDACCGTGASALPAAEIVGASGRVLAVDLAPGQIARARRKATARGLAHLECRVADVESLAPSETGFDAVLCVFGVFFLPDMARAIADLWRRLRPGGALAITTWGPRLFEPASGLFWEAVRAERPDLFRSFDPWDAIVEPGALRALFARGGIVSVDVEAEPGRQRLASPGDWWTIVLGSGYRGIVERLDPEARERVRRATLAAVEARGVTEIETNVVYGVARRS